MSTTSPPTSTTSATTSTSLPPTTTRAIAEARTALEASMQNIGSSLDRELQTRAQNLHSNDAAVEKQITQLQASTKALAKETDKLQKIAEKAARSIKELGDVENWAGVLEREFLILKETVRLVEEGSEAEEDYGPCRVCGKAVEEVLVKSGDGEGEEEWELLWCKVCEGEFHKECVGLESVPLEEWTCVECEEGGMYLMDVGKGKGKEAEGQKEMVGGNSSKEEGQVKKEEVQIPDEDTVMGGIGGNMSAGKTEEGGSQVVHVENGNGRAASESIPVDAGPTPRSLLPGSGEPSIHHPSAMQDAGGAWRFGNDQASMSIG